MARRWRVFYQPPGWGVWLRGGLYAAELRAVESVEAYRAEGYRAVYARVDLDYQPTRDNPERRTLAQLRREYGSPGRV